MNHSWASCGTYYSTNGKFVIANETEWVIVAIDATYIGGGYHGRLIELRSTNQGTDWSKYDTVVIGIEGAEQYAAAVDSDGVIHVIYTVYNAPHSDFYEVTRTAWQTWTAATLIYSCPDGWTSGAFCLVASPDATELTFAWLPHDYDDTHSRLYGAKWTTADEWDASATYWSNAEIAAEFLLSATAAYDSDGVVYVASNADWTSETGCAVLSWVWGNSTYSTLATATVINGVSSLIVTGSTLHVLYVVEVDAVNRLYFDSTLISGSDVLARYSVAVFAQRVDGVQVIYYLSNDATEDYFTLKRSQMASGVPGTVLEYCPSTHLDAGIQDYLTHPAIVPNIEGILAASGWYYDSGAMNVLMGEGLPEELLSYSFPWLGRFQLCHKIV